MTTSKFLTGAAAPAVVLQLAREHLRIAVRSLHRRGGQRTDRRHGIVRA